MKLIASMIVRNEMGRYLTSAIPALLRFCDEVRVLDDGSADGTFEWLEQHERVVVARNDGPPFSENEGIARQRLFGFTMEGEPTHVLAIDADEFVSDGQLLRARVADDETVPVWALLVCEVWMVEHGTLWLRKDGGWEPSYSPVLFKAPDADWRDDHRWQIPPRVLASGREPYMVVEQARQGYVVNLPVELLHFGWTNAVTRQARYDRYIAQDGGEFHSREHLDSIVKRSGVTLVSMPWPQDVPEVPFDG